MDEPLQTATSGSLLLEIFYEEIEYRVRVTNLETRRSREGHVPCTYVPSFGIDAADMMLINELAEEMSQEIE